MIEETGPMQNLEHYGPSRSRVEGHRRAEVPAALVAGCAVVLAMFMLVPSVAASGTATHSTTAKAPYSGTRVTIKEIITSACGSASLSHGPTFNLNSGVGRVQANASATSATSCSLPELESLGEAVGAIGLTTANFSLSKGTHTIKVVWDLHWVATLKATGAGHVPSNLVTAVEVEAVVEIWDVTTGSYVNSNLWLKETNRTGDASVHIVGNRSVTESVSATFNASHVYQVLTAVEIVAAAGVAEGATAGQASASLNMASGGNKAQLVEIQGL
jgi:hypothetical protein